MNLYRVSQIRRYGTWKELDKYAKDIPLDKPASKHINNNNTMEMGQEREFSRSMAQLMGEIEINNIKK